MRRLFVLAFCFYAALAQAQWQWKDNNGSMVFSDQPPPSNIKPAQIIKRPAADAAAAPAPAPAPIGTITPATAAPAAENKEVKKEGPKSTAEKEADFRKRNQERADAEKKAQEDAQRKQAMLENCTRLRGYLRSLEGGDRIAHTDPNGEKSYLDDAQRQSEIDKAKRSLAENCKQ